MPDILPSMQSDGGYVEATPVVIVNATTGTAATLVPTLPGTGANTSVASSTTTATLLAANANRKGATVYNESTSALYLNLGAGASVTAYSVLVAANGYYEVPFGYTGILTGLWATANGSARVTQLT